MTLSARTIVIAGAVAVVLALGAAGASADTSITVAPPLIRVDESGIATTTIFNTGDTPYEVQPVADVKWLEVPKPFWLEPNTGKDVRVVVNGRIDRPDTNVIFTIPPPKGSGIAAAGGVALQLDFAPFEAAPVVVQEAGLPWWLIFAATFPVLILIGWAIRRRHRRPRAFGF